MFDWRYERVMRAARATTLFMANVVAAAAAVWSGTSVGAEPVRLSFNRDVRPILSDNCFYCHGPDSMQRKADLRLDRPDGGAIGAGDRPGVVTPGRPESSELVRRLTAEDPQERMPPADSGRTLSAEQIAILKRWVAEGARFENHWSLIRPERPATPEVERPELALGPVDRFVLERLQRERLAPAPPASRATLVRRATLDLTGLPPTPEEVDAFLADDSPDAYERLIDRLLASPRHGERAASRWLDAARYADTSGYQSDGPRQMWRWRDWVIESLNRGLPFDRFTIDQLAGDLAPAATLDQRIATGFNRNHRGNSEGGIIPEEYAVEYVVDRVDTTATVWLGLTLACARCHEHKFDPLTQREYYGLFAFFNNVPEYGRAIKEGNSPPFIKAPTALEAERSERLRGEIEAAERRLREGEAAIATGQAEWESSLRGEAAEAADGWSIDDGLVARFSLDDRRFDSYVRPTSELKTGPGRPAGWSGDGEPSSGAPVASGELTASGPAVFAAGRIGGAARYDGRQVLAAADVGDFHYFEAFSLAMWVAPDGMQGGTIVSRTTDAPRGDGYSVRLVDGKVQLLFVKRWHDDALRLTSVERLDGAGWRHLTVVYDGSRSARGVALYVDGRPVALQTDLDLLNQTFQVKEPFRIGGGGGAESAFHGSIDEVRVYGRALEAAEARVLATADRLSTLAARPDSQRTANQREKLRAAYLDRFAPEAWRAAARDLVAAKRRLAEFESSVSTVMVMEEMTPPRTTRLLRRGEYDKPGEAVEAGVPASLPPLPAGAPDNRLGLARWLVDPGHPLTARVAVNRVWQAVFGQGLVRTTEDFGSQGQPPTHPELLDWLAVEFRTGGPAGAPLAWDVKRLWRTLATSNVYRRSSRADAELRERDPDNRWLARAPRLRLPAEMIRDQALSASGLLVERIGGPSVKPYQPADLWKDLATDSTYVQSTGGDLYRRTLYTFWKRTVAPPTLVTFDAAAREACVVRDSRTNTPLQALTLLNETTFVEAARALAQRAVVEGGTTVDGRLNRAFRLLLGRAPSGEESAVLRDGWQAHRDRYAGDLPAARALLAIGDLPAPAEIDPVELAAYTTVASVLLNLDETVTKE